MSISNIFKGCSKKSEEAGRFSSENLRSNEDINESKYGISSDLFQNSAEFDAGGFE